MKEFVFSGENSGELYRSKSLVDMYKVSKGIKELDKKNDIQDKYYYEVEIEKGEYLEIGEVKIYKRGNKVFWKSI